MAKRLRRIITVLMSVYNGERWLEKSILSVLSQSFADFEFIIVNDGSDDSSLKIIENMKKEDKRIKVINKPHTGLADSLNKGIIHAQGEWIARIDADDLCEPDRIARQLSYGCSQKDLVLIGSGHAEINQNGEIIKTHSYPEDHEQLVKRLRLLKKSVFSHSSAFISAKALKSSKGYRARLKRAQDYDLWLRLSEIGKIKCIPTPLVKIRLHPEQVTHSEGGKRQKIDARIALASYFLRACGHPDPVDESSSEKTYKEFYNFIERGLQKNGLLDFRCFVTEVKKSLQSHAIGNIFKAICLGVRSPKYVMRYLKEFMIGEQLALVLSKQWIKKGAECAA